MAQIDDDLDKLKKILHNLNLADPDHEQNANIGRSMASIIARTQVPITEFSIVKGAVGYQAPSGKWRSQENHEIETEFRAHLIKLQEEHSQRLAKERKDLYADVERKREDIINEAKLWAANHRRARKVIIDRETQMAREGLHKEEPPVIATRHDPYGRQPKPITRPKSRWE
jgi:hypothetical protein